MLAYESSAQGTLEHSDGKHRVTRIVVQPRISLKSGHDMEAAHEAIKDTVDPCMISNSILATVQVDPQFDGSVEASPIMRISNVDRLLMLSGDAGTDGSQCG